ncbi:MAG: DUF4124 domain-containing protein [Saezia sp.]
MNQNKSKIFRKCVTSSLCAGMLALAFTSGAWAQWRWVDESGRVHMSDQAPPPSVPDDKILNRPNNNAGVQVRETRTVGGSSDTTPATMSEEDRKLEEETARLAAEQAKAEEARKREDAMKRERACEGAKKRVLLLSGKRIQDINSKGEVYFLSDAEVAQRKKEALAEQREYCQ